jgi:hypothetical protein
MHEPLGQRRPHRAALPRRVRRHIESPGPLLSPPSAEIGTRGREGPRTKATEMTEETYTHFRAAWGLLAALEREDSETASALAREYDPFLLQQGLTIVAQCLLDELRRHGDCDCGSLRWVDHQALVASTVGEDD